MQSQLSNKKLPKRKGESTKPRPKMRPHEYASPDGNDQKRCIHSQGRGETYITCGLHKAYPIHDLRRPPGVGPRP